MREFISYAVLLAGILCAATAMAQDKPKPTKAPIHVTGSWTGAISQIDTWQNAGAVSAPALQRVEAYAADHDAAVTVTKRGGYWFVEADGLDAFGTGKTIDEAAEDFIHCADMLDHEPVDPAHAAAQCPNEQGCI